MRYYKFWFFLLLSLLTFSSFGSAVWLKFNLQNNAGTNINLDTDVGTNRLNPIHFNAGGNYFGGVLLWINTYDSNRKIAVAGSSTSLDCRRRIKGLYYNDQRGERLRPLDEETKESFFSGSALTISGGLYTTCSGAESLGDPWGWGIYGYIGHEYNWESYKLLAGVQYAGVANNNPGKPNNQLGPTLQSFDNKIPLGLVYDYNGGLGFLWCEVKGGLQQDLVNQLNTTGVKNFFVYSGDTGLPKPITGWVGRLDCSNAGSSIDTLLFLKIQGLIGMSSDSKDVGQLLGNENDAKTQYFSSVQLNNASLVNLAKQKAEELCRGNWKDSPIYTNSVICINWADITSSVSQIWGKIVIVKNGNLTLNGQMTANSPALNIFIDGGKLILAQSLNDRISFNEKGYPITSGTGVYTGIFLKGNFIINGIVVGNQTKGAKNTVVPYKTFIHGKFTSLNTYIEPSTQRQTQLNSLLNSNPLPSAIDLREVFSRRCDYGISTDDQSRCPVGEFQTAPLIIINQNYPSKLVE